MDTELTLHLNEFDINKNKATKNSLLFQSKKINKEEEIKKSKVDTLRVMQKVSILPVEKKSNETIAIGKDANKKIQNFQYQDKLLIEIFKYEYSLKIEEKISICFEILQNKNRLVINKDFYDEECLYSLINWALRSSFEINYSFINKKENLQENFILLNSIIFIFQYFPLNQKDFKSFKIMPKLNKIKKNIKNISINCHSLIENLIFELNAYAQNFTSLLGKKTLNNHLSINNERIQKQMEENDKNKVNFLFYFFI